MFNTFIKRPLLSTVISVLIVLLGLLALTNLPVTQFPDIVPPSVTVTTKYTGASADVCVKAVATPLERAINGVPDMLAFEQGQVIGDCFEGRLQIVRRYVSKLLQLLIGAGQLLHRQHPVR